MRDQKALTSDILGALWRLFDENRSRSSVSEEEILMQANCTHEELLSTLREDEDVLEIMQKTGFIKGVRDRELVAHA